MLLAVILAAQPALAGVLFDRPEVAEQARDHLATAADGRRPAFAALPFPPHAVS